MLDAAFPTILKVDLVLNSVSDLQDAVREVWGNPRLSGYLVRSHADTVALVHGGHKASKSKKKGNTEPEEQSPAVIDLQNTLNAIPLTSWKCVAMLHEMF